MGRPPRLGSRAARVELGLFAFAPALAVLAFRARHESWWWLGFAVPALLGCAVAIGAAFIIRGANPEPVAFADITDVSDEVLGHIGSYLLAVVVDFSKGTEEVVLAGVIMGLIVLVHVASGRVHVNPLLYVLGYRTYRAASSTGATYYLVARSDPADWTQTHSCAPLGSSVLVESALRAAQP